MRITFHLAGASEPLTYDGHYEVQDHDGRIVVHADSEDGIYRLNAAGEAVSALIRKVTVPASSVVAYEESWVEEK